MNRDTHEPQNHEPEFTSDWREDEFEVASDTAGSDRGFFVRIRRVFNQLFRVSKHDSTINADLDFTETVGFEENEAGDYVQGDGPKNTRKIRIFGSKQTTSDLLDHSGPIRPEADDFDVAFQSGRHTFEAEETLDSLGMPPVSGSIQRDEFEVAGGKLSKTFESKKEIVPDFHGKTANDDFDVSSSGDFNEPSEPDSSTLADGGVHGHDLDELQTASITGRTHFKDQIKEQLTEFKSIIEVAGTASFDSTNFDSVSEQEEQGLTVGDDQKKVRFLPFFLENLRVFCIWLAGLPVRCLTQTGSLNDQTRSKLEPVIAAIPALLAIMFLYTYIIRLNTSNLLREVTFFDRIADRRIEEKDWTSARIAIKRSCLASSRPANLWKYAQSQIQSDSDVERTKGYFLTSRLASTEFQNFPDAHIYLATELLKRKTTKIEELPNLLDQVKFHLRAALASAPNRYDALEMLLDLLMMIDQDEEVERLVMPRLEAWPVGYYYLSRISFSKGDRINQNIQANFSVKYYESMPQQLKNDPKIRERYLLSLALAGQWEKLKPIQEVWLKSLESQETILNWKNRFLAIQVMEKLSLPPEQTTRDIQEVIVALRANPQNRDLWNVLTRFADREAFNQGELLHEGIEILKKNPSAIDSDGLMIWGNLARKWKRNDDARLLLERSIALNPKNVIAANNLSNILYKEKPKDYDKALQLIEGVLELEPANPIYLETRGQILALLGRDEQAIDDLTRSLGSFPDVPEIHETLVKLLRRNGRTELALGHESRLKQIQKNSGPIKAGQIIPKPK